MYLICLTFNCQNLLKPKFVSAYITRHIRRMTGTPLPRAQGPMTTGCADLMFGKTTKGILMRIFYPASIGNIEDYSQNWTPWFLGYEYTKGLAQYNFPAMPSLFQILFNWQTKSPKIPSIWEAPLAKGKFPLVIFSHGLSGHRGIYSAICNDLASHGFIVAVLEHRDESACGTFTLSETGKKEWIYLKTLGKNVKEYPLRSSQVKIRAEECTRTLDLFVKLQKGEQLKNELSSTFDVSSLGACVDLSQPVLAGHSFGGATTILALSKDNRFKLGVALDPWMFPLKDNLKELKETTTQPMLIILTEAFQSQPNFKAFAKIDNDSNAFVTLKGSVHQNQSDTPFLFGYLAKALGGCLSAIDPHLAISLNNKLIINFICKHLGISHYNKEMDIELAREHLQIGLGLKPATAEETEDLLQYSHNHSSERKFLKNMSKHTAARL